MKIKTLLAKAKTSTPEEVMQMMKDEFWDSRAIGYLPTANEDYSMEDGNVYATADHNRFLSSGYATRISPLLQGGEFVINVTIDRLLDNKGFASQRWESEFEETVKPPIEATLKWAAARAAEVAIEQQAQLFVRAGMPEDVARKTAKRLWNNEMKGVRGV